jgi:hypothetical protein
VVARFDFEQQAAAAFLKQVLKSEDRATVFAIDQSPRMIQPLTTATAAAQSVMTVKAQKGYTAFFDSVLAAAKYLDQSSPTGRRRIVVVISDGDDTARIVDASVAQSSGSDLRLVGVDAQLQLNQKGVQETQHEVQRSEITFYSINPSGQSLRLNAAPRGPNKGSSVLPMLPGARRLCPEMKPSCPRFLIASPQNSARNTCCNTIRTTKPRIVRSGA